MRVEEIAHDEWAAALPDDGHAPFHEPEALDVVGTHAAGRLRLLGGFKGEEPVGLLPVVEREESIARAILSPPPGMGIRRLGPVLMPTSPKPSKRAKLNARFTEAVVDELDATDSRTVVRLACGPAYDDPRPYDWAGFDVVPSFTYRLSLADATPDAVMDSFSRSLRRDVRDGEDLDVTVGTAGREGARQVYEATRDRFVEQDLEFPMSWPFMRDLLEALDDRARVYVAESPDGEFLGGISVLYAGETATFWKGGTRGSYDGVSINSLLHWRIIEDVLTDPALDDVTVYDFYTANEDRIARYKSKFGGDLTPYYEVESSGLPTTVAKQAYRSLALGRGLLG